MRPIKLTLTAFGPYKDEEVIDFRELESNNLFVISGKTGSGKTTIFDGISFALYGSASGEDRENTSMLRSQFADDNRQTSVELIFEIKGRTYRVLRQLGHVKSGNKSKTGEKYEYYEIMDHGEIPRVDRQIVTEINKEIESLIGLTQEQFKQIVMLPQGEFRKFLTSDTENKEAILRRLFKTETYKQIETKLKDKQGILKASYIKDEQQLNSLTQNIIATLPAREESILLQLIRTENYNTHQVLNGLIEERKHYENVTITQESIYKKAQQNYEDKLLLLTQSKKINEQIKQQEIKEKELSNLNKLSEDYRMYRLKVDNGEKAERLIPYATQLNEVEEEVKLKKEELVNETKQHELNISMLTNSSTIYKEEEGKQTERDNVSREIDRLKTYMPIIKELEELHIQQSLKQKSITQADLKLTEINKKEKMIDLELIEIINTIERIDDDIISLPAKEAERSNLQTDWKKLNNYQKSLADLRELEGNLTKKHTDYETLHTQFVEEEACWLNNEAAFLASNLIDGMACLVCGSLEHPNKAEIASNVMSKKELDILKVKRDQAQSDLQEIKLLIKQKTSQLDEQQQELKNSSYQMNNVEDEIKRIENEGKELAKVIISLKEKQESRKTLILNREKLRENLRLIKEEWASLTQKTGNSKLAYEAIKGKFEVKLSQVPEEFREVDKVNLALGNLERKEKVLKEKWDHAQSELTKAQSNLIKSETKIEQLTKQYDALLIKRTDAEKKFAEELSKSQFVSIEAYNDAIISDEYMQKLKKIIKEYDDQTNKLATELDQLKEELKEAVWVDLEKLEEEVLELKNTSEQTFNTLINSRRAIVDAKQLLINIEKVRESLRENEEALNVLTDLYDITRGQNELKISFERYLQIEYLEQIIRAANIRLKDLSNGQFNLILSERQETHGKQSGLALDVNDAYTGQVRDVKTLSGGEKFNASLSLALGMSDVIQSFEGNISIDMMFIDEGFGSLDEESLTKAIDTLIDLQKSGRLVGVISHVEDLKAEFPAILEVQKTKEGYSKTSFKIK